MYVFAFLECPLRETDHPLELLQRWGSGRLVLRYTVLSANGKSLNVYIYEYFDVFSRFYMN